MRRKLDQRGVAALEFCLVAVPLFMLMFAIFDLGRYAIAMQSLRMLANAGARAVMINDCYVIPEVNKTSPTCTGDPLSDAQKQTVAPFLYGAGLTPKVNTAAGTGALTVTAYIDPGNSSQSNFMIMGIWPAALTATVYCSDPVHYQCASTSIPF
jgi:hypothetical protein